MKITSLKHQILLLIFSLIFFWPNLKAQEVHHTPFYKLTNTGIDSVLRKVSRQDLTITEKMNYFSGLFLGTPYKINCVGDGPYALYEPWPLVNFQETNCMAFCEHVLALAISDNWDNFFNNLQQIRYKDGLIGMKTRNHYTMADWLPENSWILEDVSAKVGGEFTKHVTRTISHSAFFAGKGITDTSGVLPDRSLTIDYIPLADIQKVSSELKTGDILALLFAKLDNIFSAHMLMIVQNNNQKYVRESSNSKMNTFDTPYQVWAAAKQKLSGRYLGIAVMRIKDSINQPGKIIHPASINILKNKN